ncbi:MAG TPA: hypothetical protein DEP35_23910 [Deltaproteobacteria bacterium]|jgi:hypothetical protein|nr:hypothetical protein [Deltaproteobacteria bacterium]
MELTLRPDRISTFEQVAQKVAERAVSQKEKVRWNVYQTMFGDLLSVIYVWQAEDWTDLEAQETAEVRMRRFLGEKEGQQALEEIRCCLERAQQSVSIERPELSYLPDQPTRPAPFAMVTRIHVRPGGVEPFEELVRKVAEAIPKVDEPARLMVRQTIIGNLREYAAIRPLQSLKELSAQRTPADLLIKAFGPAEGGLIFRTGNEAIEHIERRIVAYRQDLSNPR